MKGHERPHNLLVLAILFSVFLSSWPRGSGASHQSSGMSTPSESLPLCRKEPRTIWIRNACHGGFLTLIKDKRKTKVFAQHRGIRQNSPRAELIKESCHDPSAGFMGSVTARLYSPRARKYICFNPRGKVVAKSRKSARRMGLYCTFLERAVTFGSQTFVQFQSSHDPDWYLGFDGKRQVHKGRKKRVTLPRRMKRTKKKRRRNKCDFSFTTGEFRPTENEFSGLIEHIRKQRLDIKRNKDATVAKTTNNDIVVRRVSKPAYYYIESNDERYKPEEMIKNEDDDVDEEDELDKKMSFLDYKNKLKMYKFKKSLSSDSSSSSNRLKIRRIKNSSI